MFLTASPGTSTYRKIFVTLITLDITIIMLHLLLGSGFTLFHLDFEKNVPTIYQSAKLLLFGLGIAIQSFASKDTKYRKGFLIPLSFILIALGTDELLQIHENAYRLFQYMDWFHPSKVVDYSMKMGYRSSLWILYYLPVIFVFIFWIGYWFRYFQQNLKNNFYILGASSVFMFLVLFTEVLSSTGTYEPSMYNWLILIEESSEMFLASTLILAGTRTLAVKN